MQSQTIASAGIRVENAIKWLKEYKAKTLSYQMNKKIVDDMVIVAGALYDLKQNLALYSLLALKYECCVLL